MNLVGNLKAKSILLALGTSLVFGGNVLASEKNLQENESDNQGLETLIEYCRTEGKHCNNLAITNFGIKNYISKKERLGEKEHRLYFTISYSGNPNLRESVSGIHFIDELWTKFPDKTEIEQTIVSEELKYGIIDGKANHGKKNLLIKSQNIGIKRLNMDKNEIKKRFSEYIQIILKYIEH